jgi:predicted DNA-binding protein (MmcQ/YjbR family)
MNIELIRNSCLELKASTEDSPFGDDTICFRVMNKIFAILPLNTDTAQINLKCNPEYAVELREQYTDVQPGFHMNKMHWNTVYCENGLENKLIKSMINHSYELIVASLPKKVREELASL